MLAKIRKAVVAGAFAFVSAFVGATVTALQGGAELNAATVSAALGVGICAAALAGRVTWRVPNDR